MMLIGAGGEREGRTVTVSCTYVCRLDLYVCPTRQKCVGNKKCGEVSCLSHPPPTGSAVRRPSTGCRPQASLFDLPVSIKRGRVNTAYIAARPSVLIQQLHLRHFNEVGLTLYKEHAGEHDRSDAVGDEDRNRDAVHLW